MPTSTTTEFNTLFETITSIAEKVDPVKLNATLSAAAQAVSGLGTKFGQSIVNANAILDDLNPRMRSVPPRIQGMADLADVYSSASPDLWESLKNAVTTARTFNQQQVELDAALMASIGFGNAGADVSTRGSPSSSALFMTWYPARACSTSTARRSSAWYATTPKRSQ